MLLKSLSKLRLIRWIPARAVSASSVSSVVAELESWEHMQNALRVVKYLGTQSRKLNDALMYRSRRGRLLGPDET